MTKKALVTGITGQDGSYLAELLLEKGYEVFGLVRQVSASNTSRIDHLLQDDTAGHSKRLHLLSGDLADAGSLYRALLEVKPHEIYNLAAQSHVRLSFDIPEYTTDIVATGTIRLLDAIRTTGLKARFFQASSIEMFGKTDKMPQDENTSFCPQSPYAIAKLYSHWITKNYRDSYDLFACSGILFNHESPRRAENFVARKITKAVARIKSGLQDSLYLGNLDAKRDWGYAKEYVEAMWLMLQQEKPDDYVVATGEMHSVREFVETAFRHVDLNWKDYVKFDPRFARPAEVQVLVGDPSKARRLLGWKPKVTFNELVKLMVEADLRSLQYSK